MKTELEKKRLFKEATRLLNKANAILDDIYKKATIKSQRSQKKAA